MTRDNAREVRMKTQATKLLTAIVLLSVAVAPKCQGDPPPGAYDSLRLTRLAGALKAGEKDALADFWKEVQGKAPLVEPIPGDKDRCWVTFLYRGTAKTERVALRGGLPVAADFTLLTQMPGTDLWYITQAFPKDSRFCYFFVRDPPAVMPRGKAEALAIMLRIRFDPLNPRKFGGRPMVELPDAPPQPLLERQANAARGNLSRHKLTSKLLKTDRAVTVYLPPDHEQNKQPCRLLILFDGDAYLTEIPGPAILDNLLARGTIPPLAAVFVHQRDRLKELTCSEPFADFVATELVPWARKNFRVSDDSSHTVVGGLSVGGLMAAYCGLRHSGVIGNVLSQSGSFWYAPGALEMTTQPPPYLETGWLTRQFVEAPRLPLRFYLEVGRFEGSFFANQLGENRRLRDVLQAKGYEVTYSEFDGGHDGLSWRGTFARGLLALIEPTGK
jgi:enterochelin esterase family protein